MPAKQALILVLMFASLSVVCGILAAKAEWGKPIQMEVER